MSKGADVRMKRTFGETVSRPAWIYLKKQWKVILRGTQFMEAFHCQDKKFRKYCKGSKDLLKEVEQKKYVICVF